MIIIKKVIYKINNNKLDEITFGKSYEVLYIKNHNYYIINDYGLIEGYNSSWFEDLDEMLFKNLQIDFATYCDEKVRECSCDEECTECALRWCFINYINKEK